MSLTPGFALLVLGCALLPAQQRDVEIAGNAGYGVTGGEDQRAAATGGFGASLLWPATSQHAIQIDYLFADFRNRIFNRHFVTGSYVLQGRGRGARPFVQFGAGVVVTTFETPFRRILSNETDFTGLLGAGFTIDASPRIFIRPQVRAYLYVGPTVTLLPSLSLGWRF